MTAEPPSRPEGPDPGLDVDAAFAEIVAHWGPVAPDVPEDVVGTTRTPEPPAPPAPRPATATPAPPAPAAPAEPVWGDSLNSQASWEDEGHFVPPVPPPLPTVEPRRRLAWTGLVGAPVLGLLLLLLRVAIPTWASSFLVCAFVGGFCYLIATMGQSSDGNWPGDDGAVL
jgi:hypothetical protein